MAYILQKGVFSRYDPTRAGGVNAQAFPNVYVYPWVQNNLVSPPTIQRPTPTQTVRTQPIERGTWFRPPRILNTGASARAQANQTAGKDCSCPTCGSACVGGKRS